jgi:hypothetical protein
MTKPPSRFRLPECGAQAQNGLAAARLRGLEFERGTRCAGRRHRDPIRHVRWFGSQAVWMSRFRLPNGCRPALVSSIARSGGGIMPAPSSSRREPGIGKSTLLLQAAANVARDVGAVLYSSGEESGVIKSRGERLQIGKARSTLLAETCLERIFEAITQLGRRSSSSIPFRPSFHSRCSQPPQHRRSQAPLSCCSPPRMKASRS